MRKIEKILPPKRDYGGAVHKKRRKSKRPFDANQALHVTMRSARATGLWSFQHRRNKGTIHLLVLDTAERYGIKIHRWENVFNHLHFLIEAANREDLKAFLRVLPQRIMFAVTGARKGSPKGRFFDQIAWSRIVNWGWDFEAVLDYLWKNTLESLGCSRLEVKIMTRNAKLAPF